MFRYSLPVKRRAGEIDESDVYAQVADILVDEFGVPRRDIRPEARITEDLRLAGADGADLIRRLDERFEMDWTGFRPDLHFGPEAFGPPLPWDRDAAAFFEPQPLTLARLVEELRRGRWSGTPRVPVSSRARAKLIGCSWAQMLLLMLVFAVGIWGMVR